MCAMLVVLAAAFGRVDARMIANAELNYTLVLPEGFHDLAPQPGMPPGTVAVFATSDPSLRHARGRAGIHHFAAKSGECRPDPVANSVTTGYAKQVRL
jgi:hypothetical protein